MSEKVRVLALLGVYRADWDDEKFNAAVVPLVVGTLDILSWEHMTDAEVEAHWAPLKERYDPRGGMDYVWREAWIELDSQALRQPFEIQAIPAEVVASAEERGLDA